MLPLALGAAVNTRVLATESTLLTGPTRPVREVALFGAGTAAPLHLVKRRLLPLDCQVKREDASPIPSSVGRRRVSLRLGDRTA